MESLSPEVVEAINRKREALAAWRAAVAKEESAEWALGDARARKANAELELRQADDALDELLERELG